MATNGSLGRKLRMAIVGGGQGIRVVSNPSALEPGAYRGLVEAASNSAAGNIRIPVDLMVLPPAPPAGVPAAPPCPPAPAPAPAPEAV